MSNVHTALLCPDCAYGACGFHRYVGTKTIELAPTDEQGMLGVVIDAPPFTVVVHPACNHKWHGLGDIIECERCWIQLRVTGLLAEKAEAADGRSS